MVSLENVNMKSKWTNVVIGSTEYYCQGIYTEIMLTISYNTYHQKLARDRTAREQEFSLLVFRSSPLETQIQLYIKFPSFYAFFRANPIVFGSLLSH